jgi:hypothetical protein
MKVGVAAICIAFALAFSPPGHGASRLRAHYEVNVRDAAETKTVRAASNVVVGAPIKYELEKYTLVLAIDVPESGSFVLTVWLHSITNPKKEILKAVFNGQIGGSEQGPMRFTTSQNGVAVSGAISVVSIDN